MQGDKVLMGGTHEGGHRPYRQGFMRGDIDLIKAGLMRGNIDLMGGPNFDRLS